MNKLNQKGMAIGLLLGLMSSVIIAILFIVLFIWAYLGESKYKNNVNQIVSNAVAQSNASLKTKLNSQFAIQSQLPFTSYTGPFQYGNVYISYPKNWSAYIDTSGAGALVEGYFNPNYVPGINQNANYALRLEITSNSYASELANYTSQQSAGNVSISPFQLIKVPSMTGVIITGQIRPNKNGTMVVLPIRTNTLKIWTDSTSYNSMLVNQILPLVKYNP